MNRPSRGRAALFGALLAGSLLVHGAVLKWSSVPAARAGAAFDEAPVTIAVHLVAPPEPAPPPPEPPPPPDPPPPDPLPPPEPEEEAPPVLAAEEAPAAPIATPRPRPAPQPKKPAPQPKRPPAPPQAPSGAVTEARPDMPRNRPPAYPEIARRNGWEGQVVVRASVTSDGRVASVSLQRGSGYGVLDQAALQAVRRWRFQPRTVGGRPVDGAVEVPVNFSLRR